jgi:hypothetical protein
MATNLRQAHVAVAITALLFATSSPARAQHSRSGGETYGEIAARLGVQWVTSSSPWRPSGDVNGQVGYPLKINPPGFACSSGWTSNTTVYSGTLPPGMVMDGHGGIAGIPTERGHWVVVLKLDDIYCNGHHYTFQGWPDVLEDIALQHGDQTGDPSQCAEGSMGYCNLTTIRFHITGTGEVH